MDEQHPPRMCYPSRLALYPENLPGRHKGHNPVIEIVLLLAVNYLGVKIPLHRDGIEIEHHVYRPISMYRLGMFYINNGNKRMPQSRKFPERVKLAYAFKPV